MDMERTHVDVEATLKASRMMNDSPMTAMSGDTEQIEVQQPGVEIRSRSHAAQEDTSSPHEEGSEELQDNLEGSSSIRRKHTESERSLVRLFNRLDVAGDGKIDTHDLRTVMQGVGIFPSMKHIRDMIAAVSTDASYIDYDTFCRMRKMGLSVELNVLAQFKKFDISADHRGYIMEWEVRQVLKDEGLSGVVLENAVQDFMSSDSNGDDRVSYRELYERMMEIVPDDWLAWIYENIQRGVTDSTLYTILRENGFRDSVARDLILRTRKEGRLQVERSYAERSTKYVYNFKA